MKYDRLTNMSYTQATKMNQSLEYQRLALLEDAIENNELLYIDAIKSMLSSYYHNLKLKGTTSETLLVLNDLMKNFSIYI